MSLGFNELNPALLNAPSMTYRGSVAPKEAAPRITMLTSAPATPACCTMSTPGVRPCKVEATLEDTCLLISWEEMEATAPVRLDFFCTP